MHACLGAHEPRLETYVRLSIYSERDRLLSCPRETAAAGCSAAGSER